MVGSGCLGPRDIGFTGGEADFGGTGLWASGVGSREIKFMVSGSGYPVLVSGSLFGVAGFWIAEIVGSGSPGPRDMKLISVGLGSGLRELAPARSSS